MKLRGGVVTSPRFVRIIKALIQPTKETSIGVPAIRRLITTKLSSLPILTLWFLSATRHFKLG